jgi:hypothetical protein
MQVQAPVDEIIGDEAFRLHFLQARGSPSHVVEAVRRSQVEMMWCELFRKYHVANDCYGIIHTPFSSRKSSASPKTQPDALRACRFSLFMAQASSFPFSDQRHIGSSVACTW